MCVFLNVCMCVCVSECMNVCGKEGRWVDECVWEGVVCREVGEWMGVYL